jgi:RpiR family transcriptional regulator, carbohydrate utilization regulator
MAPDTVMRETQAGALIRLRGLYPSLKAALQKVADVILRQPEMAIYASVNELAAVSGVSEATVMRFCRTLGFKGFQDFKIALARELVTPAAPPQDEVARGDDPAAVCRKVFQANLAALQDTLEVLEMKSLDLAARMLLQARQVLVMGLGNSGLAAAYARNRLRFLGLNASYYPDYFLARAAAAAFTGEDVLLSVSHSGASRDLLETVRLAKAAGARIVSITSNALSPLARLSDLLLVTASREKAFQGEGAAAFLCQIAVIDGLAILMCQARPEQARQHLAHIKQALNPERP